MITGAIDAAVQIAIAVGLGLAAARSVGLRAPVSEAAASGRDVMRAARGLGPRSAAAYGVIASLGVIALDVLLFRDVASGLATRVPTSPGRPVALLASFYGGITEEILLRPHFSADVVIHVGLGA